MSKLMGVEQPAVRGFATSTARSSSCACAGIFASSLSLRDLVEMMQPERGLSLAHYRPFALGVAIRTGVREALESGSPRLIGRSCEGGRDIRHQNSRRMVRYLYSAKPSGSGRTGRTVDFRLSCQARCRGSPGRFFEEGDQRPASMLPGRSLWMAMPGVSPRGA